MTDYSHHQKIHALQQKAAAYMDDGEDHLAQLAIDEADRIINGVMNLRVFQPVLDDSKPQSDLTKLRYEEITCH